MKTPDLSEFTLLIAEDNEDSALLLKKILKQSGIKILHAKDGVEAVDLFEREPGIDLVLMDAMMPRMSGFEATRQIKKMNNEVPVVMLTAYINQDSIRLAVSSGCNDYLSKPIMPAVLHTVVQKWLTGIEPA
jgi:two-component system, cell cycle response regulator DivK